MATKKEELPNGFSYRFSFKIYTKLQILFKEDRVFIKGFALLEKEDDRFAHEISPLAKCFILHLVEQIKTDCPQENYKELLAFMELVNEFLKTTEPD